jgi:lysyl-tRNA synthetase class I
MSVVAAMNFIRRARTDPTIRAALEQVAPSHRAICAIGAEHGMDFTAADFDRALKIEWAARWAHFGNPDSKEKPA